jgi:hypothetical protein
MIDTSSPEHRDDRDRSPPLDGLIAVKGRPLGLSADARTDRVGRDALGQLFRRARREPPSGVSSRAPERSDTFAAAPVAILGYAM